MPSDGINPARLMGTEFDGGAGEQALANVERAAAEGTNLLPPLIDAVSAYATLGEITRVLKTVFGEFREPSLF